MPEKQIEAIDLDGIVKELEGASSFGFDFETTGFSPHRDRIEGLALSVGMRPNQSWYIPFMPVYGCAHASQVETFRKLRPILSNPEKTMVGANLKFELKFLAVNGESVKCRLGDTVVGHWLLDENSMRHGLKEVVATEFGVELRTYKEAKKSKGNLFGDEFSDYAKDDARYARKLWLDRIFPGLCQENLDRAYTKLEEEIIRVLADMELAGFTIDIDYLEEYGKKLMVEISEARMAAIKAVGRDFDPASPQQLSTAMFDWLGLPVLPGMVRGKSGFYSTDEETLSKYKNFPAAAPVLDFRGASKLENTYVLPLLERARLDEEHRVHPSFKHTRCTTGRLACEDPNAQNWPAKKNSIRKALIAAPGMVLIDSDFNQIEFRMAGHFALHFLGRSNIADAYAQGMDLHEKTMISLGFDRMFKELLTKGLTEKSDEYKQAKKEARRRSKIVNFGFIYGRGVGAFAAENNLPVETAKSWRDQFHGIAYPELRKMRDVCAGMIFENGCITTLTLRKRRFPEWKGVNDAVLTRRAMSEGWTQKMLEDKRRALWWTGWVAWNALVQGGSADYVKATMVQFWQEIKKQTKLYPRWARVRILLQVHDELVVECPEEIAEVVKDELEKIGATAMKLLVEMKMESKIIRNWDESIS